MGIPGVMPSKKTAEIFNVQFTTPMVSPDLYNITLPRRRGVIIIIWNLKGVQKTMGKTHAKTASLGWVGELFFFIQTFWQTPMDPHPGWRFRSTLTWVHVMSVLFVFVNPGFFHKRCCGSFLATKASRDDRFWMLRNRRMQKDATGNSERSSCGLTPHFPG